MTAPQGPARRDVLAGAGATGLAVAALAACGKESEPAKASVNTTVSAEKVPLGGGFVDQEAKIVVTQPSAGTYHAFTATCPHQGCLVTEVDAATILCPCHSSRFSPETGALIGGPAKTGLQALTVTASGSDLQIRS